VSPTLNIFDNGTDTRATVLIIPVLMRQREGKPGGGKGPLMSENKSLTLGTGNDQVLFCVPIDLRNALRNPDKKDAMNRQGVGIGKDGDPASTVTDVFTPAVAYAIGFSHTQGLNPQASTERFPTLRNEGGGHAVAYGVGGEVSHALTAEGHDASEDGTGRGTPVIAQQTVVRRLTPTECERLQGFPDGWTAQRYDFKKSEIVDQADSSRYKQMGNAVAVPCVQWLLQRVVLALSDA
jgi:site-specific DNA-cytosine methylase